MNIVWSLVHFCICNSVNKRRALLLLVLHFSADIRLPYSSESRSTAENTMLCCSNRTCNGTVLYTIYLNPATQCHSVVHCQLSLQLVCSESRCFQLRQAVCWSAYCYNVVVFQGLRSVFNSREARYWSMLSTSSFLSSTYQSPLFRPSQLGDLGACKLPQPPNRKHI